MARQSGDDREAIDRAFAEMIAAYHLTAEPREGRADGLESGEQTSERQTERPAEHATDRVDRAADGQADTAADAAGGTHELDLDSRWADQHPLFSYTPPPSKPTDQPTDQRSGEPRDPFDDEDGFDPGPPPPWPRPSAAVLVGWIGVAYAVIAMIAAALGAPVPRWAAWMAVGSFVGGFALLLSRLPRNRPPESGDGAVL